MLRVCRVSLLWILSMMSPIMLASVQIDITDGQIGQISLALLDVSNDRFEMTSIVKNDLKFSGAFKITSESELPKSLRQDMTPEQQIQWRHFQSADYVLTASLEKAGHDWRLTAQLTDIFAPDEQTSILNFEHVFDSKQSRQAAHHLSDAVYQAILNQSAWFNSQLAYVLHVHDHNQRHYELRLSDLDGANDRLVLSRNTPITSLAFSPNGQALAYVSYENNRSECFFLSLDGDNSPERISHFEGINGAPAFSPDGQQLALVLSKSGMPQIYKLELKSKKLTQLTHGHSIHTEPRWSPDGSKILMTSNRGGSPQIYAYTLKDKRMSRLTFEGRYNASAQWLPDQSGMTLLHHSPETGYQVAKLELKTGFLTILSHATGQISLPVLSPNGEYVIFREQRGAKKQLGMVSLNGQVQVELSVPAGDIQALAWSLSSKY